MPAAGRFSFQHLNAREQVIDRLLAERLIATLQKNGHCDPLVNEVFRTGSDSSFLRFHICKFESPGMDQAKTAALQALFGAVEHATDGSATPRDAILSARDALALVNDSKLSITGILTRKVILPLVQDNTTLTKMVNEYMAGEETLSTLDPFLQALFTEANMIGFSMDAHQSGIVNRVGDEEKERPAFKLIPCPRCGTHSKTGHENGELCAVKQKRNKAGEKLFPEQSLPSSTIGKRVDMLNRKFIHCQGDTCHHNCKNWKAQTDASRPVAVRKNRM